MQCPIKNQALWEKVKDLTGTPEEAMRLKASFSQGLIDGVDYWKIKMVWLENKLKQ